MNNQWLVKPGQSNAVNHNLHELITTYLETTGNETSLCYNDNDQIIYFMNYPDDDSPMETAHVAVLLNEEYVFLPEDMAFQLAQSYMIYLKFLSEAYTHLRKGGV